MWTPNRNHSYFPPCVLLWEGFPDTQSCWEKLSSELALIFEHSPLLSYHIFPADSGQLKYRTVLFIFVTVSPSSMIGTQLRFACLSFRESEGEVTQLCPTLWDLMDCSLPGSTVHGILQARVLEWVAISFSRRSSQPRDWTWVSCIVDIVGRCFTVWATRKVSSFMDLFIWNSFLISTLAICGTCSISDQPPSTGSTKINETEP